MDLVKCIRAIEKAALVAGALIKPHYGSVISTGKDTPDSDLGKWFANEAYQEQKFALSPLDKLCQIAIMESLVENYSSFGIHAEESNPEIERLKSRFAHSGTMPEGAYTFLIDPIDGTRNLLNTNPKNRKNKSDADTCDYFAVCVNIAKGTDIIGGVFYFPAFDKLIASLRGSGTYINGYRVILPEITPPSFDDPLHVGKTVPEFHGYLRNIKSYRATSGNLLGLLTQDIYAWILRRVDILDFGMCALAYREAGGFVGDQTSKEVDLTKLVDITSDREGKPRIYLSGFMALAPSEEYHKNLMAMFIDSGVKLT